MRIRRVVSGQRVNGKSQVASDAFVESIFIENGFVTELWGGDEPPVVPQDGTAEAYRSFFPPPGGYRFLLNQILPDSQKTAKESAAADASGSALREGAVESLEGGENAGMHTSQSVDFIVVLSGTAGIELDDGVKVLLQPGDAFVQNGTRHRWFNPGDEPATFVAVMVGGRAKAGDSPA